MEPVKRQAAFFVPHCDRSDCTLGDIEFDCPNCEKYQYHYGDFWWEYEKGYGKSPGTELAVSNCEDCDAALVLIYDPDEDHSHYVLVKTSAT
jgi:hypothetical protein